MGIITSKRRIITSEDYKNLDQHPISIALSPELEEKLAAA